MKKNISLQTSNKGILIITLSEVTQLVTTGIKDTFTIPLTFEITDAWIETTAVGGATVDILKNGVSVLGNKLVIDASKTKSKESATQVSVVSTTLSKDSSVSISVLAASGTTTGLKLYLEGIATTLDGSDINFISFGSFGSMTLDVAGKANRSGDTFTGNIAAPAVATTDIDANLSIEGETITAGGTDANVNILLITKGLGTVNPSAITLPILTTLNATSSRIALTVTSRPDDYVANVQANGTITFTGIPEEGQNVTIGTQVYVFKAVTVDPVYDVFIGVDAGSCAINLESKISGNTNSIVTVVRALDELTVTAKLTSYLGALGNAVALTETCTGVAVSGAGTLANGVSEVRSYLEINGKTYTFGLDSGDDPTTVYPNDLAVITAIGATVGEIAIALYTQMLLDVATFTATTLSVISNVITGYYIVPGAAGNLVTYVNHLVVAGDILDTYITAGKFTGGTDGAPGKEGQIGELNGFLYMCTTTDLTVANVNWRQITQRSQVYQQLLSSASIDFDLSKGVNARVPYLSHDATVTLSNLTNGDTGIIVVINGAEDHTFTLVPSPDVASTGGGVITLPSGAGIKTVIFYSYDGTDLNVNYLTNYTKLPS